MNEEDQNQNIQTTSVVEEYQKAPHPATYAVIVIALIAGIIGGLYGSLDLAKRPFFQNLFGQGPASGNSLTQSVAVTEESATTQVVSEAGGAVVSIIISKDVSKLPGYGFNGFGFFQTLPQKNGEPDIQEVGAGTGFFVTADGWIMTNKHVVNDDSATYTVLTNDGQSYPAEVKAKDPGNDIAILKIDISNAPYLRFADSAQIQLGQRVIAIGNSLGEYQNTVTSGVISGIGRSINAGGAGFTEQLDGVIQTDAAINRGNSGGPLLNLAGSVVGINTAVDLDGQSIGFAIPASDAKVAFESYQANGKITRPYLGVRYMMLNKALAQANNLDRDSGAWVVAGQNNQSSSVISGGPAANAGIKDNDIILEINKEKLTEENSLLRVVRKYKPGDRIEAKIYRDGSEQTISITVGEAPQ